MKYEVNELATAMKQYENEQFENWKSDVLSKMRNRDSEYSLKLSERIMELDLKNSLLTVNYSEKLVLLIREIRQLIELGFRKEIPQEIMDAC